MLCQGSPGLAPTLGRDASEMGTLSALVTPVSVKGDRCSWLLRWTYPLSFQSKIPKIKLCGELFGSLSSRHCSCEQTAGKLLMDYSLLFSLGTTISWPSRKTESVWSKPTLQLEGGGLELDRGPLED